MHTWPVAYLPDFALGVCVAGLIAQRDEKEGNEDGSAKKNDDDEEAHLVDRSDSHLEQEDMEGGNGSSRRPASGFTAIVRKFASCGTARWYGILADVWMLFFILYLFRCCFRCFLSISIHVEDNFASSKMINYYIGLIGISCRYQSFATANDSSHYQAIQFTGVHQVLASR